MQACVTAVFTNISDEKKWLQTINNVVLDLKHLSLKTLEN